MGKPIRKATSRASRKNPHAVALGRMGGLKGGPARAKNLTPEQLRESARRAVQARWEKAKRRVARHAE